MTRKSPTGRKATTSIGVSPKTKELFKKLKLAISHEREEDMSEDALMLELLRQEAPKHGVKIPDGLAIPEASQHQEGGH
jgi:hypothetical protein